MSNPPVHPAHRRTARDPDAGDPTTDPPGGTMDRLTGATGYGTGRAEVPASRPIPDGHPGGAPNGDDQRTSGDAGGVNPAGPAGAPEPGDAVTGGPVTGDAVTGGPVTGDAVAGEAVAGDAAGSAAERLSMRTVYRWGVAAGLGLLTVWLAAQAFVLVRDLAVQVIIAAFVAVSLDPPVRWLVRHRVRRSYAVAIMFMITLAAIAGFLVVVIPPLVRQATQLTTNFPGYMAHLQEQSPTLARLVDRFNLQPRIENLARTLPGQLGHQALAFGRQFFGALLQILLVFVLTIYIMADLPRLRALLVRLFPLRHRTNVSSVINVVIDKVGSYMIGNIIISLIAGAASFIAFEALGINFALPLAIMVAITDLIPMVGATIGAVMSVLVAVATTDLLKAVILAGFFIVYQQTENYFIAPKVLRNSVDMPALAVLLAAMVGGSVLGLVGALMAIPVAAAIKAILTPVMRAREEEAIRRSRPGRLRLHRRGARRSVAAVTAVPEVAGVPAVGYPPAQADLATPAADTEGSG